MVITMKNLYKFSKSEAKSNGELKEYRESFNENIYCRDFLDDQLNQVSQWLSSADMTASFIIGNWKGGAPT